MRKSLWIFALLLWPGAGAAPASAQTAAVAPAAELPKWDLALSAGLFENRPLDSKAATTFGDESYGDGRFAASIGYFWTAHFKTEVEFAHTGEGRRWEQEVIPIPGTSLTHPIGTEVFHRLQQGAARVVWQFNRNTWVHPYVNGGFVVDRERRTSRSPDQYYYPGDPRTRPPILLRPAACCRTVVDYRYGVTAGGGSKFYVSPNAYINAGLQVTYAKPAATAAVLLGFGVDF